MTKKEYLEQACRLEQQIETKLTAQSTLRALVENSTYHLRKDAVQKSRADHRQEEIIARIIDLDREINEEIDRLVDMKTEITNAICSVQDSQCHTLLRKKYLEYKKWPAIMAEMHCSKNTVLRIHERALRQIELPETKIKGDEMTAAKIDCFRKKVGTA